MWDDSIVSESLDSSTRTKITRQPIPTTLSAILRKDEFENYHVFRLFLWNTSSVYVGAGVSTKTDDPETLGVPRPPIRCSLVLCIPITSASEQPDSSRSCLGGGGGEAGVQD
jgi:hypothetical protein